MIKVLVDENLSEHLANGLHELQFPLDNGIKLVSMAAQYGKGTQDEDWLPDWGKKDGIFLAQDLNISRTRHLADLLKIHQSGALFLKPPKGTKYWELVTILIRRWPEIVEIIKTKKRPFSYVVSQNKLTKM